MTKLGMKCQQNIMWFEFMLDWLQLRTRKLFVFTSIFSFRFLVDLLYEQSSLQDNSVGSFLYVVLWNTFIFRPYKQLPANSAGWSECAFGIAVGLLLSKDWKWGYWWEVTSVKIASHWLASMRDIPNFENISLIVTFWLAFIQDNPAS